MKIPFYYQETCWTCGAAAMRMALEYCGIKRSEKRLVKLLKTSKIVGSLHKNFSVVAEHFLLNHVTMRNARIKDIKHLSSNNWVVIINYSHPARKIGHYVVITKVYKNSLYLNDPEYKEYKEDRQDKISFKKLNHLWYAEHEKRWLFAIKKTKEI